MSFIFKILIIAIISFVVFLNIKSTLFTSSSRANKDINPTLIAVGKNNYGQLGVQTDESPFERREPEVPTDIIQMAAGRIHSLVLTKEGTVWIWGGNDWKQLGNNEDLLYKPQPQENMYLSNIKKIAASNNHSLALDEEGFVWAFGSNFSGQLGTGDNEDRGTPTKVKDIEDVTDISAGYKFSLALKKDGSVWGWGASCDTSTKKNAELWWENMLGSMTSMEGGYYDANSDSMVTYDKNEYCINEDIVGILSKTPIQIKGLPRIVSFSSGYGHALLLDEDGNVWSFGCNTYKQLGHVTEKKEDNTTPQKVSGLPKIKQVSAGYRHSLALSEDGTLFAWGQNSHGQLTSDHLGDSVSPITIPIDNIKTIIAGYDFSFILKNDGTVWGWGRNAGGWFGDTDSEYVTSPMQVPDLNDIDQLVAGGMYILAHKK